MCQMYPPSTSVGMPAVSQMARSAFGPARRFPPVMAAAAVEAHRGAVLDHLQAIALQLRLVDPAVAGRPILGRHGAAGLGEADGRDHAGVVSGCSEPCQYCSPLGLRRGTNGQQNGAYPWKN